MRSEVLILLLEDNNFDAELITRHLYGLDLGVRCERASDRQSFVNALDRMVPDLVLSDNSMRSFDALAALRISQKSCPDTPFVVISGTVGEERVVDMLRAGVTDYVFKSNLMRLGPVLERALAEATQRNDARTAENDAREANRRFQLISQDAPIGIFQTDESLRFVFTNRRWSDITGVDPQVAQGKRWEEVVAAERCPNPLAGDDPSDELSERFELQRRTGRKQTLLMTSRKTLDGAGLTAGRVGTLADITAEVDAETAMSLARTRADEASQLKSDFLANMTHEIRTPLIGVIGMADLLLNTRLDDMQHECAVAVRSSGEALMGIVNNILDFSVGRVNEATLDIGELDLRALLYDVVDLLAISAQQKDLELMVSIENNVPAFVLGDASRIRRVLTNVLGNAIKFTDQGEIVVRAQVVDAKDPNLRVQFQVSDTGGGIAAKDLTTIFDPFVQVDASKSRQHGGTGLGLAISSDLVALMGGQLSVDSELGRGSTFAFTIGLAPSPTAGLSSAALPGVNLSGLRLLIVDGNDTQRRLWKSFASEWGVTTISSRHYAGTLEVLRSATDRGEPIDVALVNRMSVGEVGLRLANAISADPGLKTVTILVSPLGLRDGHSDVQAHTNVIHLSKPVHRELLLACLTAAAGQRGVVSRVGLPVVQARSAGRRILLAEDNIVNQKITTAMLTSGGYVVDVAVDGAQALEAVTSRRYDAILMDCMMPVMNGFEATAAIRAAEGPGQHIPIIALTASSVTERQLCLGQGMDDFVAKPANKTALLAMIGKLVEQAPHHEAGVWGRLG